MDILNTKEVAAYVRLGRQTIEHMRLTGNGPPFTKFGRAVRYRRSDIDAWIESRLQTSTSASTAQ